MEHLPKDVISTMIDYLTLNDFWRLYETSQLLNNTLQQWKLLKTPFYFATVYTEWNESFRRLNKRDLGKLGIDFKNLVQCNRYIDEKCEIYLCRCNLWKNQDLIKAILKVDKKLRPNINIEVVPFIYKEAFSARKNKFSLSKYAKYLLLHNIPDSQLLFQKFNRYNHTWDRSFRDFENILY